VREEPGLTTDPSINYRLMGSANSSTTLPSRGGARSACS